MNLKTLFLALSASVAFVLPVAAQIRTNQMIQVSIQGVPQDERGRIDGAYSVSSSGYVTLPFVGNVRAAGLSTEQLAVALQSRFRQEEIYDQPVFQVMASNQDVLEQQMVHVGGQVRQNGPIAFSQGMTINQAVLAARGANEFGALNRVELLRDGRVRTLDLNNPSMMNVPLQPGDMVMVPQKNWRGR